jgi:hypothetical protein
VLLGTPIYTKILKSLPGKIKKIKKNIYSCFRAYLYMAFSRWSAVPGLLVGAAFFGVLCGASGGVLGGFYLGYVFILGGAFIPF